MTTKQSTFRLSFSTEKWDAWLTPPIGDDDVTLLNMFLCFMTYLM
jgi:hypothetical protein